MTQEQIEQAANEYLETYLCNGRFGVPGSVKDAFLAGAESRQAEIDELIADAERYKNDVAEGLVREKITQKIISDKLAEIGLSNNKFRIMHNCMSDLFERQYDDRNERGSRIQRCFKELEKYKKQSK